MSENVQTPIQGVVIANILPTLSGMPQKLEEHKARVDRATAAAEKLIQEVSTTPEITDEQDERMKTLIIRIEDADKVMKGERMPFTQLMDTIAKAFTGNEARLKVPREKLQSLRNMRASQVAEREKQARLEQERKASKGKEYADIVAFITNNMEQKLSAKKADRKKQYLTGFEGITLDNFSEKEASMRMLRHDFPYGRLDDILNYFVPAQRYHTADEVSAINKKLRDEYNWDAFMDQYRQDLGEYMDDLIARLPAKKEELLEKKRQADEAERLRREKEEQERKAAELRAQQEKATAQEKERLRKEQEALERQQAETRRREQEQKEEQERQRRAQQEREERERLELEASARREREEAENKAEAARATAHAQTLFDQVNNAAPVEGGPETRQGWEIEISSSAGYVELFQFWFQEEGAVLWEKDRAKFEKMTFAKLVSFAENKMKKGKKIESKNIKYTETHTAVNRREKKED